jgi:hypothetical protein
VNAPTGANLLEQIQLNRFAASARAKHRSAPKILGPTSKINAKWFWGIGKIIDLLDFVKLRLAPRKSRPKLARNLRESIPHPFP